MLTGDLATFAVDGVAVAVIRRIAKHADVPVILQPAHLAVVRDVAPDQVAARAEVGGTLRPPEAGGDALDGRIADLVLEALIQGLDPRIGIARVGQIAERQSLRRGRFDCQCRGRRRGGRDEPTSVHSVSSREYVRLSPATLIIDSASANPSGLCGSALSALIRPQP